MHKILLASCLALPLAAAGVAGGLLWANSGSQKEQPKPQQDNTAGYICPVTGEELPCPECCPFNQEK